MHRQSGNPPCMRVRVFDLRVSLFASFGGALVRALASVESCHHHTHRLALYPQYSLDWGTVPGSSFQVPALPARSGGGGSRPPGGRRATPHGYFAPQTCLPRSRHLAHAPAPRRERLRTGPNVYQWQAYVSGRIIRSRAVSLGGCEGGRKDGKPACETQMLLTTSRYSQTSLRLRQKVKARASRECLRSGTAGDSGES